MMRIDGLTVGEWFNRMHPVYAPDDGGGSGGGGDAGAGGDGDGGDGGQGDGSGDDDGDGDGSEGEGGDGDGDAGEEYQDDPALSAKENKKAREEFDKAKAEGKKPDGDKAKDKAKKEGEEDKDKSELFGAPDGDYAEFETPEGFDLAEDVKTEFDDLSRELNLSDAGRKKLVDMQAKLYSRQAEQHAERVAEWGDQLKKDKTIGGKEYDAKVGTARKAISEFGDQELKDLLENSGFGNHPAIVRFAYRAGEALGEGRVEPGDGGEGQEDAATILYGKN